MSRVKIAPAAGAGAMRAWVGHAAGSLDNVKSGFVEVPNPDANELRVRLAAATVNPVDWKHVHFGGLSCFPAVFGVDGSGVVDAVGSAVTTHKVGDRVHFFGNVFKDFGSFADYTLIDSAAAHKIPDGMSYATAAVSPCAAWTAYEALFKRLCIEAGKTIYISAGAGGVGHYATQMAAKAGCKVITSASGDNVARLRSAGHCALVIDYKNEDVKEKIMGFTSNQGCDYVFEMLSEAQATVAKQCLKFRGQICHIATTIPTLPDNGDFFNGLTHHHVFIPGNLLRPDALADFMDTAAKVNAMLMDGSLTTDVSATLGFDDIGEALRNQEKGHVRGKVLISYSAPADAVKDAAYKL
eukprot:PhM_4_TR16912/c0_g1_i1/m.82734